MNSNALKRFINKDLLSIDTDNGKLSLFKLAFPLFFASVSGMLMSFISTIVARNYADGFFVIPLSIASTGISFITTVASMVSAGASVLLSAYIGGGKREDVKKIIGTSLILSVILAIVLAGIGYIFAEPLLDFMGMNKAEYAVYRASTLTVYKIRLIEIVIYSLGYTAVTCLQCFGYTQVGLISGLASNVVNLASVSVCLFAVKISADNAAYAFAFSFVAGNVFFTVLGLFFLRIKKIAFNKAICFNWVKKIFAVGIPASVSAIFYSLSQLLTATICLILPPSAYLAKTYIAQIVQFTYRFGYSIGQASSVMVGHLCGMGKTDKAFAVHNQNLKIVLTCNIILSSICAIFGRELLQLFFNADESVLAYSIVFFADIAVEIGRGMNHVGEFGLNAAGDVKFTTVVSVFSCWAFGVGLAYVFVVFLGWGLLGMWCAFAIDELFRGCTYLIRWRKRGWKKQFEKMMSDSGKL